jgi:nucleoside 2-deoxyribosyltransferase
MQKTKEKVITIIVNAREKEVEEKKLSYHQIIELAYGQMEHSDAIVYTVTYSKGKNPDKGSMVEGDTITVKQGMIFNVTRTDKS